jgi:diphthamide synthase (EF-2-diphthine--ammonia ligase)
MKPKALFNWSSGKDSALALYKILQDDEYEVKTLLTSINKEFQRISMHGVHVLLLERQASSWYSSDKNGASKRTFYGGISEDHECHNE